jgi:hypothetical protein
MVGSELHPEPDAARAARNPAARYLRAIDAEERFDEPDE